ncbi:hypothetical protein Aperf_G00000010252 [Anoplocephala perfoliata]
MLSHIWFILTLWILSTRAALPVATDGPAGSSFSKIISFSDVDLGAFTDVNSDRRTDAVVFSSMDSTIYALVAPTANDSKGQFKKTALFQVDTAANLSSIAVADFNGDSQEDYLLIYYSDDYGYDVKVLLSGTHEILPVDTFKSQPIVCDVNADMIADIYGQDSTGSRVVYLGDSTGFLTKKLFTNSMRNLASTSNSGFSSLGTSTNPSLILLTDDGMEVFTDLASTGGRLGPADIMNINLPSGVKTNTIGKFVFGDFDMSRDIKILLLNCENGDCKRPQIWISPLTTANYWVSVPVNLRPIGFSGDGEWSLASVTTAGFSTSALVGPSLGDVDLDGYPDLAVGLKYTSSDLPGGIVLPAILRNIAKFHGGAVAFQAYLLPGVDIDANLNLKQIAFFDYNEDGILDLFMTFESSKSAVVTSLYAQKMTKEAYFLKVMMTNGLCGSRSQCPGGVLPYGMPGYGYRASYETQGADRGRIGSSGVFVTSSCCGALQLPFTTFGFGDFATYIENVMVSVPAPSGETRTHTLTFIVPNAQLVVIPYPYYNPPNWQTKSFLQPLYDMKVIIIAITLLATCVILLIVIGVLQYLELRADQKEKMQESQRFHFDAM